MSEELKPCPFCGDSARTYNRSEERREDYHDDFWTVECSNCLAAICESGRSNAVAAWNTRPAPVQVPDVAEVLAVLDDIRSLDPTANTLVMAQDIAGHLAGRIRHKLAAAPTPAPVATEAAPVVNDCLTTEAVAQGVVANAPCGGVDAEKVMALVQEFGEQCEAAGYLDRSGSQDASKKLHDTAYQTAVKIRALLASPAAVGWIPVSERLPDMPSGYVLVHCEGGNITNDFFCRDREFHRHAGGHYSRKAQGKESGYFQCSHRYGYRVTHWQPLPSPPAIASQEPQDGR